jgi:hypothetical protein
MIIAEKYEKEPEFTEIGPQRDWKRFMVERMRNLCHAGDWYCIIQIKHRHPEPFRHRHPELSGTFRDPEILKGAVYVRLSQLWRKSEI